MRCVILQLVGKRHPLKVFRTLKQNRGGETERETQRERERDREERQRERERKRESKNYYLQREPIWEHNGLSVLGVMLNVHRNHTAY